MVEVIAPAGELSDLCKFSGLQSLTGEYTRSRATPCHTVVSALL